MKQTSSPAHRAASLEQRLDPFHHCCSAPNQHMLRSMQRPQNASVESHKHCLLPRYQCLAARSHLHSNSYLHDWLHHHFGGQGVRLFTSNASSSQQSPGARQRADLEAEDPWTSGKAAICTSQACQKSTILEKQVVDLSGFRDRGICIQNNSIARQCY